MGEIHTFLFHLEDIFDLSDIIKIYDFEYEQADFVVKMIRPGQEGLYIALVMDEDDVSELVSHNIMGIRFSHLNKKDYILFA